jgi:hypothetical protein
MAAGCLRLAACSFFVGIAAVGCTSTSELPRVTNEAGLAEVGADPAVEDTFVGITPPDSADVSFDATTEPAPPPKFDPAPGSYGSGGACGGGLTGFDVKISSSVFGAKIYFTIDGSEPTRDSALYSVPIHIAKPDQTIKAFVTAPGFADSGTAVARYILFPPGGKPITPTLTPKGGTYSGAQTVSIMSPTAGVRFCYSIDSDMAVRCVCETGGCIAGTPYTGPFLVEPTAGGRKVMAIACTAGDSSDVAVETYTAP